MSSALEVQSPNCWTPREVPRGRVLFVFVAALPTSSHGVLLSGVPSGASWLHSATKVFPDCPPAFFFFLFLGICFFLSLWPIEELVFVFRIYGFPKVRPDMDFSPSALWLLGQWTPVWTWETAAVTPYVGLSPCSLQARRQRGLA